MGRKKGIKEKYIIEIYDDNDILVSTEKATTYQDIVDKYPVWNHRDNVRNYFRRHSGGYKTKKSHTKYKKFKLIKI